MAFLRRTGTHTQAPRPDVVLLDLNLPRMNGREVLEQTKSDPHLGAIPVLVFTTSADPGDITTSYALHANAYVTKPINLDDFTVVTAQISQFFAEVVALPTAS